MAAAMGGLDALVFTGGIGEHQPPVRAEVAAGLGFLGVAIDQARNRETSGDADISAPSAQRAHPGGHGARGHRDRPAGAVSARFSWCVT